MKTWGRVLRGAAWSRKLFFLLGAAMALFSPVFLRAQSCELYPIALSKESLSNVVAGTVVNVFNGAQPGNFGWLSWGGSPSEPALVKSLTPAGDSSSYVNPDLPTDHQVSVGDWVQAKPGVSNSKNVRDALDSLKTIDITIPIWDQVRGQGEHAAYHVAAFANVRLISYQLPGQNQITARFLGYATCGGQNLPPVVNAGPDLTNSVHDLPVALTLNGSVTDDGLPVGGTLTSTWSVVSGAGPVVFGDIHSPATTATFSQGGLYLLQLAASDSALSATDTVVVSINLQNNPPQAFGQTVTIDEDTTTNITLAGSDPDNDSISYQVVSLPQYGTLSGTPPALTYTPILDYNGNDSFTFKVNDGQLDSAVATVNIIINPVNDAPVADAQSLTNYEDTPFAITLSGSDVEGSALTYALVAAPTNGTLSGTAPNLIYTPATNYFGADAFSFKVNDGTNDSAPATVALAILPVDDAPLVNAGSDQLIVLPTNSVALAGTVVYDNFPDQVQSVQWSQVSGPAGATFSDVSNEVTTITFTQSGIYEFRLTASDSFLTGSDDVVVTVDAPPVAIAGPNQTNTLPAAVTLNGTVTDDGIPTNGILTAAWSMVTGPGAVVFGDPTSTNTSATFSESGLYVLRLTANDGVASSSSDVSVLINRAPMVDAGPDLTIANPQVTLNGSAVDDGLPATNLVATWSQISGPGTATFSPVSTTNAPPTTTVTFSATGVYVLRLTADDSLASQSADVTISVDAAPVVTVSNTPIINFPDTASLSATATDDGIPTGAFLAYHWTQISGPGTISFADDSALATTASFSTSGVYVIEFQASDGLLTGSSNITVTVNQPPVAQDQSVTVVEDSQINVMLQATDAENQSLTYSIVSQPSNGTLTSQGGNQFQYTPGANFFGSDSFTFKVNDGYADSPVATVTLTVLAQNDAPSFVAGANQTVSEDAGPQTVSGWASNISPGPANESSQSVHFLVSSDNPSLFSAGPAVASDGTLTYTTATNANGVATITVRAQDDGGTANGGVDTSAPQTFTITVTAVDDAPRFTFPGSQIIGDAMPLVFDTNRLISITDVDAGTSALQLAIGVAHGTLTLGSTNGLVMISGANGSSNLVFTGTLTDLNASLSNLTYTSRLHYSGDETLTLSVNDLGNTGDGGPLGDFETVAITVVPTNHAPVFVSAPVTNAVGIPLRSNQNFNRTPVDLSAWHILQYGPWGQGPADWTLSQSNTTATQQFNADASALMSDVPMFWDRIEGGVLKFDTTDNDFIGFIFGFENSSNYYLFDWKQETEAVGAANGLVGMSVKVITADPQVVGSDALWSTFESNPALAHTLYHNSIPYATSVGYSFMLDFRPGDITIQVSTGTNVLADIHLNDTSYPMGKFGFYNFSQAGVFYTGFNVQRIAADDYTYQAAASDVDGDTLTYSLVNGPTNMTVNATNGLVQWVPDTSFSGTVTVTIQVSDDHGGTALQTFPVYVPPPLINKPPFVSAGPDGAFSGITNAYTLEGSIIDDGVPTNAPLTVSWSKVFGPGNVTFGNSNAPVTTAQFSTAGLYRLQLVGSDSLEFSTNTVDIRADMLCTSVPTNIVMWLPATLDARDAITGTTGITQNVTYPSGKVGLAFSFNGSSNSVRMPAQPSYDVGASPSGFTIEFWGNQNFFPQNGSLLGWANGPRIERFTTSATADSLRFFVTGTNVSNFIDAPKLWPNGTWTHIAVTYDRSSGLASFYINGIFTGSTNVGPNVMPTSGDFFLAQVPGSAGNFAGLLDEVSIYSRPLNAEEIFQIFAAGLSGKCPDDNNLAPEVFAGPDLFLRGVPATTTLQGEVTDDGLPLNWQVHSRWSVLSGPGTVSFADANSPTTSATFSTNGVYVLQLTADDGEAPSSDLVEIRVEDFCAMDNPQGLVAWWPANGIDHDAINGYDAIRFNGANYTNGRVASAFNFDGVNDFVRMPAQTNYDIGASPTGFTVEFWLNAANFQNGSVLGWANGVRAERFNSGAISGDSLRWDLAGTNSGQFLVSQRLWAGGGFVGKWVHLALTYERSTGIATLYVNGLVNATANVGTNLLSTAGDFYLENVPGSATFFTGQFDEVSLYSRPLSRLEVLSLFVSGSMGKCLQDADQHPQVYAGPDITIASTNDAANLSGFVTDDGLPAGSTITTRWQAPSFNPGAVTFGNFNSLATTATFSTNGVYSIQLLADDGEKQGSDFVEVRVGVACPALDIPGLVAWWPGNGNTIDKISGIPAVLMGADYTNGKVAQAFNLHGTNDFVFVSYQSNYDLGLSTNGFSIEFWIKGNFISGSDQGIWSWNNSATNGGSNGINMRQAGSSISCDIRDVNGVDHGAGGGVVFDGNWHHYAVTYDRVAGQLKSYVDGTLRNTVAAGVFQADTRYDLQIGRALGFQAGNLHGQFDEIALYNRPLTLTEVQTIFNAGAAGKCITPSNMPPLVSAGSDKIISLPTNTVTLDGAVFDDALPSNTLALAWTYIAGDSTVFFSSTNTAATSVSFTNTGTYTFQLTASDGQFSASDTVTISVLPDLRARPTVTITAPEDQSLFQVPTAGTTNLTITATAADADGQVTNVEFFVNGSSVGSVASAPYSTTVPDLAPATYVLTAVATDNDGLSTTSAPVTAIIFVDSGEPEVGIFNPADSTIVTAPTNIIGIANSPLLQSWHLRYRLAPPTGGSSEIPTDDAGWATLASGNTSVVSNTLATFDPTMLLNGIYQVQVVATDLLDRSAFSQVTTLVVDRNLKIGQFTISFNDLSVPVPGLPIQIVRTYDSRAAAAGIQGDFGTGWTLDIRNVRLQKNRSLGADWQETSTGGLFPTYALDPIQDRIVSITFPDGNVQKFRLEPNPSVQPLEPIENPKWRFTPLGNTVGTLEPASIDDSDGEFMIVVGDVPGTVDLYDLNYFSTNTLATTEDLNRNPTLFRYTSAEGYRYLIDEVKGLQSVSDPNGNTLEIGTNGLVWTNSVSGTNSLSVAFQRDDGGRITNIVDAAGNSTRYAYSTNGDLVAFTDRTGLTNGFSYTNINFPHYLTGITDARGLSPVQNRYDTSGRLIGNIDGFGNAISYAHDLANHREYVTNRLGQVTASDYDDHGNVIHVIDANGAETFSSYDDNGNVLTTTDALGRTNTFTYDELNDRLTATDPLGNTTRFTYGAQRRVTSVTDARGNTITNTFDAKGNLLTMRDPLGNMTRFAYNDQGLPVAMTNALGQVMQFGYDDQGRLAAEVDANNHETDYARDLNGNLLQQSTTRTTPSGPQTLAVQFFYDAQSRLTNSVFPDGSSAQTLYNAIGKPAVTIDQLGRQTSMQYDELGRVTQTTYADGSKEASAYDAEGRRIASTNRLGQVTQYVYDNVGRLIRSIMPDGTSTTNYFDLAGQLLVSSDAKGNSTFYGYDAAGRSVAVTNALGQVSQSFYDASGNLTNTVDALGRSTRFVYDALNRRVQTIFPDGTTQQTFYDVLGRHFAETDQASNTTWFGYDALGRLTSVTNALGYVTTYTYDELGQQLSQTDANNHTTTFEYDSLGRRVKRTLPGNQVETYAYNIGGLLTNRTDFNGYITSYQYDVMNRLLAKVPDSRRGEPSITYAYNTLGLRTNMIDASGSTAFAYDNRNRLVQKSKFWTGQSAGVSLNYAYDVDGNLTNIVSSETNGVNLAYAYDELNRLAAVNDAALGVTAYTYDDVGNLKGSTYPNFVHSEYQYDSLNRLTNLASDRVGTAIANYAYTVAASGNRTNAVEQLFSSTLNATAKTINRVYTYDSIYRLTGETINGTPSAGSANYNYDAVGNRLSRGITGLSLPPQTFTFDANDRLNTDTYDANGNTLLGSGFGQSLADEYDFENRLVTRHTPSATVHLTYDGDGNRVSKTLTTSTNSVTTYYVVDDLNPSGYAQVLEELVATNSQPTALSCVYTYGHTLISQQRLSTINSQPSTNFYGFDGHNNVRYLTDANGNVTDTYDYDAFGNLIARTGSTLNNYLFTGEQYDADLGLYYLRARYQNTDTGRFWTQDSYEGAGSDPSSLHKYTYCGQNPINAFDPSGNETVAEISLTSGMFGVARAVFGATVGGMTGAITGGYEAIYHGQLSDQEISSAMTEGFKQGALTGGALGFLAGIGSVGQFGVSGIGLLYSGQGFVSSLQSFLTGNYQAASFEGKMAIFGTVTSVAGLTTAFTSEISGGDVIVTPNGYRNAVWGLTDATDRGELIEDAWGKNTPTQFPVWDRFVPGSGLAESIKSIDLDAPSYQSAAGVKSGVSSAITDIVNYKFDEDVVRQGYTIRANAIQQRVLRIAIPRMPSTQQFQGMQQAVEMGRMNNINVIFRVF